MFNNREKSNKEYILEYLKKHIQGFKKQGQKENCMFSCPGQCGAKFLSAFFEGDSIRCNKCGSKFNPTDLVQELEEDKRDWPLDQIAVYLNEHYKIQSPELEIQFYLNSYETLGFDLVPLMKNQKIPFEKDWGSKNHKDKKEWYSWIKDGFNIGVKTGIKSKITVIDVDTKVIPDVLKRVKTLVQTTSKGYHFLFDYEESLPSTRLNDEQIDILNNGKQFVAFPSVIEGVLRTWNFREYRSIEIPKMPEEVKKFLKKNCKTLPEKTNSEELAEQIKHGEIKIDPKDFILKNNQLSGCCNTSFIKLGGILRKELNSQQTAFALNVLNKTMLERPMDRRVMSNMVRSIEKYTNFDESELARKILDYLRYAEEGTSRDIREAIGETKTKIDKALSFLVKEQLVIKRGRLYVAVKKAMWKDSFDSLDSTLPYKMPFFHDVAVFNWGDMVLLGSKAKHGKTTASMNIVKSFVDQGIKPYFICLETGSRFIKTACQLGMKEGDFWWDIQTDPSKIQLENNSVTILDWLLIKDKAQTDSVMQYFVEQLVRTKSFLIIFMQLKKDTTWFAPNLVDQFPSLAARYLYGDDDDGSSGAWHVDVIREPKRQVKKAQIPCKYIWDQKKLVREDEVQKNYEDDIQVL